MHPSQFRSEISHSIFVACKKITSLTTIDHLEDRFIEQPRNPLHGDFSCTIAFALASKLKLPPRKIAEMILNVWETPPFVSEVTIAQAGFINIRIDARTKVSVIKEILHKNHDYGCLQPKHQSILLEFISANPTGPLHIGHGRACAYGDSLANILCALGYLVHREYYVNDTGRQMGILAASAWLRFWSDENGDLSALPEGAYRGHYVREILVCALKQDLKKTPPLTKEDFQSLRALPDSEQVATKIYEMASKALSPTSAISLSTLIKKVKNLMLENIIKKDIKTLNVDCEKINFFSEYHLHEEKAIPKAIDTLRTNGYIENREGAVWFQSSQLGDDKDRVVQRSNGEWTYFAADIAYHQNKCERKDSARQPYQLINILGADHHGYVPRLKAVLDALGFPSARLEVELIQFVSLMNDGVRQKMSTRSGEFISLQELVDKIGVDASRYFFVSRKNDQHLDFDLKIATAKTKDNPVYYIQYAKARIVSIFKRWQGDESVLHQASLKPLETDTAALILCQKLIDYPNCLERAGEERLVHGLANHCLDIATAFHVFYEKTKILTETDTMDTIHSKLALLLATKQVLENIGGLLGLSLPEAM